MPERQLDKLENITPDASFKEFKNSLALPILSVILASLSAMVLRGNPEAIQFITQAGATATVIFAADSGRRLFKHRRIKNSQIDH